MTGADEDGWALIDQGVGQWARERTDVAALDRVLAGALAQARSEVRVTARLRWAWQVVRAQVPIVGPRLLAASLLVMALGAAVAVTSGRSWSRDAFVLLAPLGAALGSALAFGEGLGELALVVRATPRLVLLARLVVVFAADLAAASAASVAVAGRTHEAVSALIEAWLGPMLLLATASLLMSVLSRPGVGITVASGLWFLRVLAGLDLPGSVVRPWFAARIDAVWVTSPAVLLAAAVVLGAALLVGPRRPAVAP